MLLQSLAESMLPSTQSMSQAGGLLQGLGLGADFSGAGGVGSGGYLEGMLPVTSLLSQGGLLPMLASLPPAAGGGLAGLMPPAAAESRQQPQRSYNDLFNFLSAYRGAPKEGEGGDVGQQGGAAAAPGASGNGVDVAPLPLHSLFASAAGSSEGGVKRPASDDGSGQPGGAKRASVGDGVPSATPTGAAAAAMKGTDDFSQMKSLANVSVQEMMKQLLAQQAAAGAEEPPLPPAL